MNLRKDRDEAQRVFINNLLTLPLGQSLYLEQIRIR